MKASGQSTKSIRRWIMFFIVSLALSGITAFPLKWEIDLLAKTAHLFPSEIELFLTKVNNAINYVSAHYPFLNYGTDWLAFAHIVIAIFFIGPYQDPVRNVWVIEAGMIACLLVFPLAFICGYIRNIPFIWQLIDCSFGAFGLIPLRIVHKKIKQLEKIQLTQTVYEFV